MVLSTEELKSIYFGAYEFDITEDGYLRAFQYSKKQIEYFRITWKGSPDSFEIAVDGLITGIKYVKDIMDTGTISWDLPKGEKNVIIYLPADATVQIRNFTADSEVARAVKNEKVLWLGDSITQGYGPLRSSCTYVSVANRILNYDIINQGIGGYIYDKNSLMKMEGYDPDKIIVALGTNQYGDKDMTAVEEYYKTLMGIYGEEIPVICITPLWRGDSADGLPTLISYCEKIKEIAGRYKNVRVIEGMKLVPHLPEYFLDNLHPNQLGCEVYGRNLAALL